MTQRVTYSVSSELTNGCQLLTILGIACSQAGINTTFNVIENLFMLRSPLAAYDRDTKERWLTNFKKRSAERWQALNPTQQHHASRIENCVAKIIDGETNE